MNIGQSLSDALSSVLTFLPKLLGFLVILIIGYIIAKVLAKVVATILGKVGFDRAVERGGIKKMLDRSQYDASDLLAKLVFYAVMLFVLSTAFGVFGPNPISVYLAAIIGYLPKLFVAILIVVLAAAIAAAVKGLIQNSLGGLSYGAVLANVASVLILALGVIAALNQLQIAQNVVNAVLYAALAIVVGVTVVAVGGGGIHPMRQRWERGLTKLDEEAPQVKAHAAEAKERAKNDPQAFARESAQHAMPGQGQYGDQQDQGQYGGQPDQGQYGGQPDQGQYGGQPDQGPYGGQYPPQPGQYPGQPGQPGQYPGQPGQYPGQPGQYGGEQPGQYGGEQRPYDQNQN